MAVSRATRDWVDLGQKLHSIRTPAKPLKRKEFIVLARKQGHSLYLPIPSPLRKELGLYESAPVKMTLEGKALRLTRLETITASQIDVLKSHFPRSKIPWAKKLPLLGRQHPSQQYELQGLPATDIAPLSTGGKGPES